MMIICSFIYLVFQHAKLKQKMGLFLSWIWRYQKLGLKIDLNFVMVGNDKNVSQKSIRSLAWGVMALLYAYYFNDDGWLDPQ